MSHMRNFVNFLTNKKQVLLYLKIFQMSQWRVILSGKNSNPKVPQFFKIRKYTKFCILWRLHWLSSAISWRVMNEITSKSLQWLQRSLNCSKMWIPDFALFQFLRHASAEECLWWTSSLFLSYFFQSSCDIQAMEKITQWQFSCWYFK